GQNDGDHKGLADPRNSRSARNQMSQPLRIQRRHGRSPLRTRRMGAAFRAGAAAPGRRQPFPGMNLEVVRNRGETVRSTTISAVLHGLVLLLLFVLAAVTH